MLQIHKQKKMIMNASKLIENLAMIKSPKVMTTRPPSQFHAMGENTMIVKHNHRLHEKGSTFRGTYDLKTRGSSVLHWGKCKGAINQ
jgi:hypothetical protein